MQKPTPVGPDLRITLGSPQRRAVVTFFLPSILDQRKLT